VVLFADEAVWLENRLHPHFFAAGLVSLGPVRQRYRAGKVSKDYAMLVMGMEESKYEEQEIAAEEND
jgi:hypothetical protein